MQALLALAAAAALLAAALAISLLTRPSLATPSGDQRSLDSVSSAMVGESAGAPPARGSATLAPPQLLQPREIQIPRLAVQAAIVPVATSPMGSLEVPGDPRVVGWWKDGAKPGARRGTAILAGHVNTAAMGPGAFSGLGRMRRGDRIVVLGSRRQIRFRVVAVRLYLKSRLPTKRAFSQRARGRIVLVSCAGPFDPSTGHYRDNIVVYAVATRGESA